MLNLKKTAVAVLAFGSSAVFAGTMGPVCAPGNVTVPCEHSAWAFGAKALYLQPSYSNFGYDGAVEVEGAASPDDKFHSIDPRWGWGFMIEGAYSFNTGNDLNLNWYHWNRTTNSTLPVEGFHVPEGEFEGIGKTSFKPRWDAVNLEFGQHVDFGVGRFVRFHGGVQYARINTEAKIAASGDLDPGNLVLDGVGAGELTMTYNGFGPRFGADMVYGFGNGLGIYAKAAGALLVGPQGFTETIVADIEGVVSSLKQSGSFNVVVPEVESKLGATYTYSMAQGDVSLDIGWMWVNYFNAQHNGIRDAITQQTNFAVQGPFVGLNWMGNIA